MATATKPIVTWRPQLGPQAIAIDARYVVDELFLGGGRGGENRTTFSGISSQT